MAEYLRVQLMADQVPEVGDVVRCFDGSFGDAIVTKVTETDVYVERPHMSIGGVVPEPQIHVERFTISRVCVDKYYQFYQAGKSKENRWHWRGASQT